MTLSLNTSPEPHSAFLHLGLHLNLPEVLKCNISKNKLPFLTPNLFFFLPLPADGTGQPPRSESGAPSCALPLPWPSDPISNLLLILFPKQLLSLPQFLHPKSLCSNLDPHHLLLTNDPV